MENESILWKDDGTLTAGLRKVFPRWVTSDMFNGRLKGASRKPCAYSAENLMAKKSGRVSGSFLKALLRSVQVSQQGDDMFGNDERYGVSVFTDSDSFEGGVGIGNRIYTVYDSKSGIFYREGRIRREDGSEDSAPFFLSMWPFFLQNGTFNMYYVEFLRAEMREDKRALACYLADLARSLTEPGKEGGLPVCCSDEIGKLRDEIRNGKRFIPAQWVGSGTDKGPFCESLPRDTDKVKKMSMSAADFSGKYAFSDRELTDEEKKLVPALDDGFVITETLLSICRHIRDTTGKKRPVRNILLRGAPGTGKSRMYERIAAGCNLPLYTFAANSDTETYDIFGSFVPIGGDEDGSAVMRIPSTSDMIRDPVLLYEQLTGDYKKDATGADCLRAALKEDGGKNRMKVRFVEGPLIKAMRHGGVIGLDEINLPVKSGVLPALNPAMDDSASILLPTGERVKRHPDCIFVSTMNSELEGTRNINQAWISRCQLIVDMNEPSDEELAERVRLATGFRAEDYPNIDLAKFIDAYRQLRETAAKKHMTDGDLGPRQLVNWLLSTMITGDPVVSASMTVIPSATARERGQRELTEKIKDIFE